MALCAIADWPPCWTVSSSVSDHVQTIRLNGILRCVSRRSLRLCTIPELEQAYEVSEARLMKVMHQLALQGWIVTVRGKEGGTRLAHMPQQITAPWCVEWRPTSRWWKLWQRRPARFLPARVGQWKVDALRAVAGSSPPSAFHVPESAGQAMRSGCNQASQACNGVQISADEQ
ncbi:Rrf2 family transcriptional regulator [Comamonas sp. C24C]